MVRHPLKADTENWPDLIKNDFIKFFVGEKIGEGTARWVYEMRYQPDLVVKLEYSESTFQNIQEWTAWTSCQFLPMAGLLAPCRRISPCGHILIQERTEALLEGEAPSKTINFISDRKLKNFGRTKDGRIVCHDYAINDMAKTGIDSAFIEDIPESFWT